MIGQFKPCDVSLGTIDESRQRIAGVGIESMNEPGTPDTRGIRLGFYVQFRSILIEETQKAFAGTQTAQASLDSAKKRGDELLRRFEQTYKTAKLP